MADKDKKQEQAFGKYILIENLKKKFSDNMVSADKADNIIVSTSILLEGIHFSMVYFPLKHLGYKAVISSLAGIYTKNGKPENLIINLGIGARHRVEDIEEIFEGVDFACKNYNLKIAEINIDSSLTGLTIAVTTTGDYDTTLKSTTTPTPTDLLCVTGDLGSAYMGLQLLERERKVFEETKGAQPRLEGFEYVIGRQLKPEIDIDLFNKIKETGVIPTSVSVLKDGLASDLISLSKRYDLGCRIYHDKVPYVQETANAGNEFGIDPLISALNGGDDYEILFSVNVNDFEKIKEIEKISVIGHFTPAEEGYSLSLQDNSLAELKAQGWEEGGE